jgi:hypothetical protein
MKTITASERSTLIRLASTLPVGDDTRQAILSGLAQTREAGRPWGGPGYSAKAEDYDIPPAQGGTGSPPCQPAGDGPCYRKHNEYGAANSGANGSAARRKYNEKYREQWQG